MPPIRPETWRALSSYIDTALELPRAERELWLNSLQEREPEIAAQLAVALGELDTIVEGEFLEDSLNALRDELVQRGADSPAASDEQRYEIGAEHARGGMGRILRATDTLLERTVAIKELLQSDPLAEARLRREFKLTARLQHPSIVPVHDAGRWRSSGKLFYSMKLVSGESLSNVVMGTKSLRERLPLVTRVLAVADAIAYAHSERVIHRDLKPSNVLIGAYGETLVADWGLAKELGRTSLQPTAASDADGEAADRASLTVVGTVLGTPSFMPPEQARGLAVDHRADVYALGAILYFVISAKAPYSGDSSDRVVQRVLTEPPEPLRVREPEAPADLCAIVEKAMARDPAARYPSALELAADLRRFSNGQLVSAREYGLRHIAVRFIARHRAITALSVLFLVTLIAGTIRFLEREQHLRLDAQAASRRADAQSQTLLVEHGRRELEQGRPFRAASYLSAAYTHDPRSLPVRYLTSRAVRLMNAHAHRLRGHTRDVVAVAFSRDGSRLATGSTDETVRVWDTNTGETRHVLRGATSTIEDVAFSADGRFIASAEREICIWDAQSGLLVQRLPHPGYRLRFSPDGRWLVAGSMQGRLFVWETTAWTRVLDEKPHADRLSAIAFAPDGATAVTGSWDGKLKYYGLPDWKEFRTVDDHVRAISSVEFSADGQWLLTGDNEVGLFVRSARDAAIVHRLRLPEGSRWMRASFAPDARTIVTATIDGTIRAFHVTSGALLYAIDAIPDGKLFDGALSPDGRSYATVGLVGGDLWRLDRIGGARILRGERHEPTLIQSAIYAADGGSFVAGLDFDTGARHGLHVWDARSGSELRAWPMPGTLVNAAYAIGASADLSRIIAGHGRSVTALWDGATGRLITQLDHGGDWVRTVAATADGALVASGADSGKVRFWRGDTGAPARAPLQVEARATSITFAPDARRLAVAESPGRVRVWDFDEARWALEWKAHPTWIESVEFSPDGGWIVTAGRQDHTAKVWDARSGRLQATLRGHVDNLVRASFSPDSARVATVSSDRTARIWDARTGEELQVVHGPTYSARFSPDGRELLTTGAGDYLVLWDVTLDPRSPSDIASYVDARSPWRLRDGRLFLRSDASAAAQDAAEPRLEREQ